MSICYNSDQTSITEFQTTDKFCPLQPTRVITDESGITTITGTRCLAELCQLWVANKIDTSPYRDDLYQITGTPNPFADISGENVNENSGRCGLQNSDYSELMFRLLHHNHFGHSHPQIHPNNKITKKGGNSVFGKIPGATDLVVQYMTRESSNSLDKIYGVDYMIDTSINNDKPPKVLDAVHNDADFRKPYHKVPWSYFSDITSGPTFPAQINSIEPNQIHYDGSSNIWIKITGAFFVDDTSYDDGYLPEYTNNLDNSGFSVIFQDTYQNYFIKDSTTMYVYLRPGDSSGYKDLTIQNWGDTFSINQFCGNIRTFEQVLDYNVNYNDDTGLQTIIRNEISNAGGNLVALEDY